MQLAKNKCLLNFQFWHFQLIVVLTRTNNILPVLIYVFEHAIALVSKTFLTQNWFCTRYEKHTSLIIRVVDKQRDGHFREQLNLAELDKSFLPPNEEPYYVRIKLWQIF